MHREETKPAKNTVPKFSKEVAPKAKSNMHPSSCHKPTTTQAKLNISDKHISHQ